MSNLQSNTHYNHSCV